MLGFRAIVCCDLKHVDRLDVSDVDALVIDYKDDPKENRKHAILFLIGVVNCISKNDHVGCVRDFKNDVSKVHLHDAVVVDVISEILEKVGVKDV